MGVFRLNYIIYFVTTMCFNSIFIIVVLIKDNLKIHIDQLRVIFDRVHK